MLSSGAGDVHYAGEIWKDENGLLHINNASGSFMPAGEDLKAAASLLEKNLGIDADTVEIHPFAPPVVSMHLPELPSDPETFNAIFGAAKASVLKKIDMKVLQDVVDRASERRTYSLDSDTRLALKQYRKTALALRSAYAFLSVNHEGSPSFERFVKALGAFNDGLALRVNPKQKELALRLKKAMASCPWIRSALSSSRRRKKTSWKTSKR